MHVFQLKTVKVVLFVNIFVFLYFYRRKFDLKGSTVDREASDKELEKHLPTLKDNDFIKQKIRICIGEEPKKKLFEILNADIGVSLISKNARKS